MSARSRLAHEARRARHRVVHREGAGRAGGEAATARAPAPILIVRRARPEIRSTGAGFFRPARATGHARRAAPSRPRPCASPRRRGSRSPRRARPSSPRRPRRAAPASPPPKRARRRRRRRPPAAAAQPRRPHAALQRPHRHRRRRPRRPSPAGADGAAEGDAPASYERLLDVLARGGRRRAPHDDRARRVHAQRLQDARVPQARGRVRRRGDAPRDPELEMSSLGLPRRSAGGAREPEGALADAPRRSQPSTRRERAASSTPSTRRAAACATRSARTSRASSPSCAALEATGEPRTPRRAPSTS